MTQVEPHHPATAPFVLSSSYPSLSSCPAPTSSRQYSAVSYQSSSSSSSPSSPAGAPSGVTVPSPSSKRKHIDSVDERYPKQSQAQRHQTHHSGTVHSADSHTTAPPSSSSSDPASASDDTAMTPSFGLRTLNLDGTTAIRPAANNLTRNTTATSTTTSSSSSATSPNVSRVPSGVAFDGDDDGQESDDEAGDGDEPPSADRESSRASNAGGLLSDELWTCFYGCGKTYRKSSGRSIRRHVMQCFRLHWPGGDRLTEAEVSALISREQDAGHIVTGLRRWRMRQSRRSAGELAEHEKWKCPWECGQFYRSTSSRSIQRHAAICPLRHRAGSNNAGMEDDKKLLINSMEDVNADEKPFIKADPSSSCEEEEEAPSRNNMSASSKRRTKLSPAESTSESNNSTPEMYNSSIHCAKSEAPHKNAQHELHVSVKREAESSSKDYSHFHHAHEHQRHHYHSHPQQQRTESGNADSDYMNVMNNSNTNANACRPDNRFDDSGDASQQFQNAHSQQTYSSAFDNKVDARYSFSPSPPPQNVHAQEVMSYNANLSTLHEQQKSVVLQLQSLLKTLYARYGMTHPVFTQPWMTTPLLNRLLGDDLGTTDSQSLISEIFGQLNGSNSLFLNTNAFAPLSADSMSSSSSSSSSSSPSRDLPSSAMFMRGDRALSFPPPLTPDNGNQGAYETQSLSSALLLSQWRSSPTPQLSPASTTSPSSSAAPSTVSAAESASAALQHFAQQIPSEEQANNNGNANVLFTPSMMSAQTMSHHSNTQSAAAAAQTYAPRSVHHGTPGLSSRRPSAPLTIDQLTWSCPTSGCTQTYKITSTKSIEKHKTSCPHDTHRFLAVDDTDMFRSKDEKRLHDDDIVARVHALQQQHRLGAYHALLSQSLAIQQQQPQHAVHYPPLTTSAPVHLSSSSNMYHQHQAQHPSAHHLLHSHHYVPLPPRYAGAGAQPVPLQFAPSSNRANPSSPPFNRQTRQQFSTPSPPPSNLYYSTQTNTTNANAMQFSHGQSLWMNNDNNTNNNNNNNNSINTQQHNNQYNQYEC